MDNTFCPWCKTGIIESGWKDADGSHGWTCSNCGDCEDHSVPIARNQAASDRYNALYNNQTYRAIGTAIEAGDIFDSPCHPGDYPVTDFMNLVTDAALSRCGHSAYPNAETKIAEKIKYWQCDGYGSRFDTSAIENAVKAHLDQFTPSEPTPPAKRATVRDMVRDEMGTLQKADILSRSLILEFNSKGVRIHHAGADGFLFSSCVGAMVWLDRVRTTGHICTPTAWECYLRKIAAPKLYTDAVQP